MKTFIKVVAISALAFLAACSSTPQASTDAIDEMASLAGSDGNLEATLEIVSVAPSSILSASSDVRSQLTYQKIESVYKGKPIQGILAALEGAIHAGAGAGTTIQGAGNSGVSAALAKGDRVKIRGRVRKVGNVPVFIGFVHSQTSQATGVGAAAVTSPTPIVLLAEGKSLPTTTPSVNTLTDLIVSSFALDINGESAGWFCTSSGSVATFRVTSPGPVNLPTGVFQAKFSGKIEWVQTQIGTSGKLMGQLTYGQNKTLEIQGMILTNATVCD